MLLMFMARGELMTDDNSNDWILICSSCTQWAVLVPFMAICPSFWVFTDWMIYHHNTAPGKRNISPQITSHTSTHISDHDLWLPSQSLTVHITVTAWLVKPVESGGSTYSYVCMCMRVSVYMKNIKPQIRQHRGADLAICRTANVSSVW